MTGTVNSLLQPVLPLTVLDAAGQPHSVEAVIDTGFNGSLTLPPALVATLGLRWLCRQQGQLADGTILTFDVYVATVEWNGSPKQVAVEVTDAQPLVGMSLMLGTELRVQVADGGAVTIT